MKASVSQYREAPLRWPGSWRVHWLQARTGGHVKSLGVDHGTAKEPAACAPHHRSRRAGDTALLLNGAETTATKELQLGTEATGHAVLPAHWTCEQDPVFSRNTQYQITHMGIANVHLHLIHSDVFMHSWNLSAFDDLLCIIMHIVTGLIYIIIHYIDNAVANNHSSFCHFHDVSDWQQINCREQSFYDNCETKQLQNVKYKTTHLCINFPSFQKNAQFSLCKSLNIVKKAVAHQKCNFSFKQIFEVVFCCIMDSLNVNSSNRNKNQAKTLRSVHNVPVSCGH